MTRIGSIAKGHLVFADEADPGAVAFAKEFADAHRGGWRQPPVPDRTRITDERRRAGFDHYWQADQIRHGFGGSGRTVYTHRDSGERFEVDVTAGTGDFWSSNYHVTRMTTVQGGTR
jgi:hypothetical protein